MIRLLPFCIELALLVFCLVDCIQTDSVVVRNLSKTAWVILIIIVPLVGGIAWLVAGRPQAGAGLRRSVPWPSTRTAGFPEYERPAPPRGPDDDPDFLADLRGSDVAHEKMLAEWQEQLRAREERLRQDEPAPKTPDVDPGEQRPGDAAAGGPDVSKDPRG